MPGLFWKTEYKKIPIAFGIEKIHIGCVVEDEICSTDALQETMEALEGSYLDEDEEGNEITVTGPVVQSVDIAGFNKL